MIISETLKYFQHPEVRLNIDIDLTSYSTLRLISRGHLAHVKSIAALQDLIAWCQQKQIHYVLIGWGANTLIRENCLSFLYIKLELPFNESESFSHVKDSYYLPASLGLNTLVKQAKLLGLKGWEVLTGIPASLGGALFMNAGTKYGEIASIVETVDVLTASGSIKTWEIKNFSDKYFAYRKNLFLAENEIIIGASLFHHGVDVSEVNHRIDEYLEYRKRTQPLATKNCGCVFKNPLPEQAGKLIDELGLKGFEMGGLRISSVHANFIENIGPAKYSDFIKLVNYIKLEILKKKNIELEMEVQG